MHGKRGHGKRSLFPSGNIYLDQCFTTGLYFLNPIKHMKKKTFPPSNTRQQAPAHEAAVIRNFFSSPATQLVLIILVGVAVYGNTFGAPFVLDDVTSIYGNPVVRDFKLAFRPRMVGELSFALNYHFDGMNVAGYHLVNLLIHLTNGCLVYALIQLILRTDSSPRGAVAGARSLIPLFTALLFVSHPIQTQAVTYISQRYASLATLFYLATLVIWLAARISPTRQRRHLLYGAAFVSALLAMGTKEIAFTLPLVILLLEIIFSGGPLRRLAVPGVIFSFTAVIIPAAFMAATGSTGGLLEMLRRLATPTHAISRGDYLLTQVNVLTTYLRLLVLPYGQNLDYDYPVAHTLFSPPVLASLTLITAILTSAALLLIRSRRSNRPDLKLIGFGILWFFITIAVESSLIPLQDVIFEHRLYLPSIGMFTAFVTTLVTAKGALDGRKRGGGTLIVPALALAVCLLAVAAASRNGVWQDEISLWEDVVAKSPAKARPHGSLGSAYLKRGLQDEAAREYETAIRLAPRDPANFNNLGTIYHRQKRWEEAARMYREALNLDPANVKARYNLGSVLTSLGRLAEAEAELKEALRRKPDYDEAHNGLGIVYARLRRSSDALAEFREAVRLNPGNREAVNNSAALSGAGRSYP